MPRTRQFPKRVTSIRITIAVDIITTSVKVNPLGFGAGVEFNVELNMCTVALAIMLLELSMAKRVAIQNHVGIIFDGAF